MEAKGFTVIALDTETTGKFPDVDRIIEVAAIKCTAEWDPLQARFTTEILESFEQLINPQIPLLPEVIQINGISEEMLREKPTFVEVADRLATFLDGIPLVAHNASFDIDFLDAEFRRAGVMPTKRPVIDTLKLSKEIWPHLENHKLGTLVKMLRMDTRNLHRARQDAECCLGVFTTLLNHFLKQGKMVDLLFLSSFGRAKPLEFGSSLTNEQMSFF